MACKKCYHFDLESSECRAKPPVANPETSAAVWPRVKREDWCAEDTSQIDI